MDISIKICKIIEDSPLFELRQFESESSSFCKYKTCFAFTPETRCQVLKKVREYAREILKNNQSNILIEETLSEDYERDPT